MASELVTRWPEPLVLRCHNGDRIEVELQPEDLFCHGTLKGEIYAVLHQRVKQGGLGYS